MIMAFFQAEAVSLAVAPEQKFIHVLHFTDN